MYFRFNRCPTFNKRFRQKHEQSKSVSLFHSTIQPRFCRMQAGQDRRYLCNPSCLEIRASSHRVGSALGSVQFLKRCGTTAYLAFGRLTVSAL